MSTITPELAQRMAALGHANEIRSERAVLKREIGMGRPILPLLVDPPGFCESMTVSALLMAVPKLGRVRVNRLLMGAGVGAYRTVGCLTDRQRSALVALLDERGGRR